jgi:hypothetical protein
MAEIVGHIVGRLAVPILSAIARAAAPAVGTIIVRPLSSVLRGAGEIVYSAVERHNHEVRRASWNSSTTVEDLLGKKPYFQSHLQKIKDTAIRSSLALLIENLRLLITTEDEEDEQYPAFHLKRVNTTTLAFDSLNDVDSDFLDKLGSIMMNGIMMVRSKVPGGNDHIPRTPYEKETDRQLLAVKVTDAIVKITNLYNANCK